MLNIIIPMAGEGSRFKVAGYKDPKPFIEIMGKPMIERVLENLNVKDARFILIVRKEHIEFYGAFLTELKEKYNIVYRYVENLTEGACCTVLEARDIIDTSDSLLIANSDQIVDIDFNLYMKDCFDRALQGSILTFEDNHPKWSYAELNANGTVKRVKEKEVISSHATVGIYFFKQGQNFVKLAQKMIDQNDRVNNEFYVCPVYNYGIKEKQQFGIYEIPKEKMHGTGTPEDLELYLKNWMRER